MKPIIRKMDCKLNRALYGNMPKLVLLVMTLINGVCPSVVFATKTVNGYAVREGAKRQHYPVTGVTKEQVQINVQKDTICERCFKNGKQKEEEADSSKQVQKQIEHSLKENGNARAVSTSMATETSADNIRAHHDSVISSRKSQHLKESLTEQAKQAKDLYKAHLQTPQAVNNAQSGTLSSLTTKDKLKRISDAQTIRTRTDNSHFSKAHSQSATGVYMKASYNKGHVSELPSNMKEKRFQIYKKNTESNAHKLTTRGTSMGHSDSTETVNGRHLKSDELPHIHNISVNSVRRDTRNSDLIRNSQQLSGFGMRKFNNQSLHSSHQNTFGKFRQQAELKNNRHINNVSMNHKQRNVHEIVRSKSQESQKKHGVQRKKNVPMEDQYFSDVAKKSSVVLEEQKDDQLATAKRRSDLPGNRLVRPSAADRLEQQISPDLRKSYLQLMNHLHRMLHMFSQSLEKIKSYEKEIFNGTRYTIMMGVREITEKLNEANDCIYESVTSATHFTRETILKYHNSQYTNKVGTLQKIPADAPAIESEVNSRNFQPYLEQAHREKSKGQINTATINAMKIKFLEGDSHLKHIRDQFLNMYNRSALRDLYSYLHTSILQINKGSKKSPQLRELKRVKMYLDHVKSTLMTANNLLINSSDGVWKAMKQSKENYETFKNWLQKEHSRHTGPPRSSQHGLSSYYFGKLKQLVSQAAEHVHELKRQKNALYSILNNPLNTAMVVLTQKGKTAALFELQILAGNLKRLLKDILTSLDAIRLQIGSKAKITLGQACRLDTEGSGLFDIDDEDLCEEEGSGFEKLDDDKDIAANNEDFVFIDAPTEMTSPTVKSLQQLGLDLTDFASKLVSRSQEIYSSSQILQQPLVALRKHLDKTQSTVLSTEIAADIQKDFITEFDEKEKHIQEVKHKIQDISQKIAALKRINLNGSVKKAKQTVEQARQSSGVDKRPSLEKTDEKSRIAEIDKTGKMDGDFDYSGLIKQGHEIVSKHADIVLLQSMASDSCGRTGSHLTHIKSNMTLLRQKVDKAREMLSTFQVSVSKSAHGYISVPVPQTQPAETASLISSIKACVKLKTLDGTLMFIKGNNSASYSVAISKGNIAVTIYDKDNKDLSTVTLDQLSVTHDWHMLEIKRTGETLSVGAMSQTGNSQVKTKLIGNLDLIQPPPAVVYLGGTPDSLLVTSDSWEGCVGNLIVNGRALALFNSDSKGIQPSLCTDHCISVKQRLAMVFSGNGFIRFIHTEREVITSITLQFKTQQKTASLLSVRNRHQNFYLTVVMDNGSVKIESSAPGESIVLLSLNSSLNDEKSHLLKVLFRGRRTYPELDGNREAFSVERLTPQVSKDIPDGIIVGALISHSRQFITTNYRPLLGCVSDIFINDNRLLLPEAVDIYNVFYGNCNFSDIWHSCWQWTDHSKPLSIGVVDNSNRISLLVSRDSLGPVIHFIKEDSFDIDVTITLTGVDVSSEDSEGVLIRPATDRNHFALITITDSGNSVLVKVWDQSVSFSYGGFWGFAKKDLTKPHTVVIGEARATQDRIFTGSVSQLTIEDRFYDVSKLSLSHNLMPCERLIDAQPEPLPADITAEEPFSCT